jgi:hypothetical protein
MPFPVPVFRSPDAVMSPVETLPVSVATELPPKSENWYVG